MKFAAALALLGSLASVQAVTLNGFDGFDRKCGKVTVNGADIEAAVNLAISLNMNGTTYKSSDSDMKDYPHHYSNYEGFTNWKSSQCNGNPGPRQTFPVIKGGTFADQTSPGLYRAIYYYLKGSDQAYYCGTIYHAGDPFRGCDVTNSTAT